MFSIKKLYQLSPAIYNVSTGFSNSLIEYNTISLYKKLSSLQLILFQQPKNKNVFEANAVVFEGPEDYHSRINDEKLNIDEKSILMIRGCGPVGYPGSAEVVNMQPPDRLLKKGINNLICKIPANFLQSGKFTLSLFFIEDKKNALLISNEIMSFTVVDSPREIGVYMGKEPGYIRPNFNWINQ